MGRLDWVKIAGLACLDEDCVCGKRFVESLGS